MNLLSQLNLEHLDTVTNDDGDVIATLSIGSNMLPHVTVDTYSTFDGDGFFTGEYDHFAEELGFEYGEVDLRVTDSGAIVRELGQAMLNEMSSQLLPWAPSDEDRNIVTPGELTSVYSPRQYNFETDSFAADYTVNLTALSEWMDTNGHNAREYGLEHFASRDGFHSYIPGRLNSDNPTETLAWLAVYAYLADNLDPEELRHAGYEVEGDIYMSHTEAYCNHRVYTDRLDKRVAELTMTHEDTIDSMMSEWSEAVDVDYFGDTPHPSELLERVETDAQKIATHVIASI